MKANIKLIVFLAGIGFAGTAFSQSCNCVPPIEKVCQKPCFIKKINKFDSKEIKGLLDTVNKKDLTLKDRQHHTELSEKIFDHVKTKKTLNGLDLNDKDKKSLDNVLKSKELKKALEEK